MYLVLIPVRFGMLPALPQGKWVDCPISAHVCGVAFMRQAGNRQLLEYWRQLKGQRSAPERNDIDPGALRPILPDVFVLEYDVDGKLPFRIAGARTNALFGRELRARSFTELWREGDRDQIATLAEAVLSDARPIVIAAQAHASAAQQVDVEILLLPLRHQGNTHSRMLGAVTPSSMPQWIGLAEVSSFNYLTSRVIFEENSSEGEDKDDLFLRSSSTSNNALNRRRQFYVISGNLRDNIPS
jgi:hypothetical protein